MGKKMIRNFLRTTWLILRKDIQVWLRQPANIAATIVPPLVILFVQALGAQAVGRSPVALVLQDSGAQGAQIAQAIRKADVFRLHEVDAAQAQVQLKNLDVVAIVTIPAGFTTRLQAHQPAQVDVTVNNLNLDLTNDIRRAVPDAVTQYYQAQGDASPIKVTMNESDLRPRDIQLFQYAVLPSIVLLLIISGLITGGLATAREWETSTVKELLLSPAPGSAVIAGKVMAGFATSFLLGLLVLALATLLGWIYPQGIYWLTTLLIVALVALLGSSLGVAIGAAFRRIQPVIGVSILLALYLFFLSGGISVLAFEPQWLQSIAAFIPLTYGNHALQMAVFYNSADLLGRDVLVLALFSLLTLFLGSLAIRRQSRY
jgi:ABC-type multidrug transport system permease subunit